MSTPGHNQPRMSAVFGSLVRRDIALAWGQGGASLLALGFFLIAVSLFPFGVGHMLAKVV